VSNQPTLLGRFVRHLIPWVILFNVVLMCAIAMQAGWFGPPPDGGDGHQSRFSLKVAQAGETTVEAMQHVSEEVREEIWVGKEYASVESFMHEADAGLAGVPGNPAFAHAVNVCWGGSYAKVSLLQGSSKHVTTHLYDRNGIRYTRTKHKVWNGYGWVTVAVYDWAIDKDYC
jgi:hypothetical protein